MMKFAGTTLALALALVGCTRGPAIQPSSRYATTAAVVDGIVYLFGGIERGTGKDITVGTVEAYEPGSRIWTACAPMPTPRGFAAAAVLDGTVYVFGGLDATGKALDTVEAYDPRKDSWTSLPGMGMARSRLAATSHLGRHILVGGGMDAAEKNSATVRVFNPAEGTWRDWPDLPSPRHGLALASAADETERVFAVGGYDDAGPLRASDLFDHDGKTYAWRSNPPLTEPRGFMGMAVVGRRLFAVGGRCPTIPRTEVLDLDNAAAGWKPAAPLPKDLCRFSMVEWKGRLLVFGGETEFGKAVNRDVLEYDPSADAWTVRGK